MTHDTSSRIRPEWLRGYPEQHYWVRVWRATPAWVDRKAIRAIYRRAEELRRQGHDVVVDHLVPLRSPHVCGLHTHENLAIECRRRNSLKGNRHWPDMPDDTIDMLESLCHALPPHQMVLI